MSTPPLNPGWLHTVLRARGLPLLPVPTLREAVAQLQPQQAQALGRACMALQSGTDTVAQMSELADFVRCARPEHRAALRAAGLSDDVGQMLAALQALGSTAFFAALRALPDQAVASTLRPHLPPLAPSPAEAPATPAAAAWPETPQAPGAADAFDAGDAEPAPGWPTDDWPPPEPDDDAPWAAEAPGPAVHIHTPAPAPTPGAPAPVAGPAATRALPRGHHVYGAKAALRVEEDRWRTDDPVRCHTLRLEVAGALSERRYDWEHKIAVQLTARELPAFAAVMLNLLPQLQAQGHGVLNDKWFELRRQSGGVLVRVGQARRGFAVPVGAGDLYELTLLALDALKANAPQADTAQVMAALQSLAG